MKGRAAALWLLVALCGAWLAGEHLRLAVDKQYNLDEFQYAHGAWLVSKGEVIYRDFFEHHLPFVHQLMAVVWMGLDDDPGNVLYLRFAMLPFLFLAALAAAVLARPSCGRWSVLAAVFALMVPTYSAMAVEVRPDPIAASLFLWALAVHAIPRLPRALRGALSGALLVTALWGTLKVAYYGLIFPVALLVDLDRWRRGGKDPDAAGEGYLLGHPLAFLAGASFAALPIAAYLTVTGTWDDVFEWTVRWSFVHQWHYPGFPWVRNFMPLLAESFWLFPLAIVGLWQTVRNLGAGGEEPRSTVDVLLVGALVTTLASFAWQSAAYLYSLIPFSLVLTVFAARGAVGAFRTLGASTWSAPSRRFAIGLLAAFLMMEAQRAGGALAKLRAASNAEQHEAWARVQALTRPEEPVYHIAGGQVARPSVHYYYFMEAVIRKLKHDAFANEYPRALVERGCVAYLWSDRFERLAEPLRRFLAIHYLPYDEHIWFWGQRYRPTPGSVLAGSFQAVRDGKYFVWPLSAAKNLEIDGVPVAGPIFELTAGAHGVRYSGNVPKLAIIWLPADGQPFAPRPDHLPAVALDLLR